MPTVVELFAGMGSASLGLQLAGFEHMLMVEIDKQCVDTLKRNGHKHVHHGSVEGVDFAKYKGVDAVFASPPCQPWSVAGLHGGKDDRRNLWPHVVRCVSECEPQVFMFENSSTLANKRHSPYLESLVKQFEGLRGRAIAAVL
jgi:DNA (cytosine-5)-methyltransferase 1